MLDDTPVGPPSLPDVMKWPRVVSARVDERFIDANGHMNFAWHMHLYNEACWAYFAGIGVDAQHMQGTGTGLFAVDAHQRFYNELFVGDRVAVHTRLLGIGKKSMRLLHAMVDLDRLRIASTLEIVGVYVDRQTRKARPWTAQHVFNAEKTIFVTRSAIA